MTSVTLGRPLVLADESGFHAPSPADFWQPYFGPEGWEITRPMFVMTLVTIGLVALLTLGTSIAVPVGGVISGETMLWQSADPVVGEHARGWTYMFE